jgi:hypothetical protein
MAPCDAQARIRQLEAENRNLREHIRTHNAACYKMCGGEKCNPYQSRGLECPDCSKGWAIEIEGLGQESGNG